MNLLDDDFTAFGMLSLTNPNRWPNSVDVEGVDFFITSKDAYLWAVLITSYIDHYENEDSDLLAVNNFSRDVDAYFSRTEIITGVDDPSGLFNGVEPGDFEKWKRKRSRLFADRFGNIGEIKKSFGVRGKSISVRDTKKKNGDDILKTRERRSNI